MNNGLSLLVPMQVQALCVGTPDANGAAFSLAPMADFSMLPYVENGVQHNRGAYINAQVVSRGGPFGAQLGLPVGVHLHWQLPAGLLRGQQQEDGSLVYPPVPNRWLVNRIIVKNKTSTFPQVYLKSWVVESDRLNFQPVAIPGLHQPTVPVSPATSGQNYRFIGQAFDAVGWSENLSAERFPSLTAVGYGEANFSSYYPNCSTVFGFQDTLADQPSFNQANDVLTYQISGWYSDETQDPLAAGIVSGDNAFGWTFDAASGETVTNLICTGTIDHVSWNPYTPHLTTTAQPLTAAIGASSQEAVSVLLANQVHRDPELAEQVINALQFGTLQQIGSVSDTAQVLNELVHEAGFAALDSGKIWQVRKRTTAGTDTNYEGEVTLPQPIAQDLNNLNIQQTELNELNETLVSKRSQLFSDWYKYLLIEYETHYTPDNVRNRAQDVRDYLNAQVDAINVLQDRVAASGQLQQSINALVLLISGLIGEGYELTADVAAPRYWQPNNPYLVLQGNTIVPVNRTGDAATLLCRTSSALVNYVELNAYTAGNSYAVGTGFLQDVLGYWEVPALQVLLNSILSDGTLLAPGLQSAVALLICESSQSEHGQLLDIIQVTTQLTAQLAAFMNQEPAAEYDYLTATGTWAVAPEMLQQSVWTGTPWLPIMVHYSVELQPVQQAPVYDSDFVLDHFEWNTSGIDLATKSAPNAPWQVMNGTMLLSAHAQVDLAQGIRNYLQQTGNTDPDLQQTLEDVAALPLLAQEFSGFNESLLMRQQSLQLKVADPLANTFDQSFVQRVMTAVGTTGDYSPEVNHSFNPFRAGAFRINALRLVDVFGRFIDYDSLQAVYLASSLKQADLINSLPANTALLPPRIAQPSRLLFRWLAADTDTIEANTHPATSPVIGWVLPDFVDNSLFIYAADGTPLGELTLNAAGDTVLWFSAPGGNFPPATPLQTVMQDELPWLRNFANGIYNAGNAAFFSSFLASLQEAALTTMPATPSGINGLLAGQPLALTRAMLSLDLMGEAVASESWDAFANNLTPTASPNTAGFENVRVPVQLGAAQSYSDGLFGYWIQNNTAIDFTQFYRPGATQPLSASPLTLTGKRISKTVLLLMDPAGSVRAASGILPVKKITVPPDQYEAALNRLAVTFLTAPVLSGSNTSELAIPLPKISSGQWAWVSADADGNWQSQDFTDTVQNANQAALDYTPQQLLEGWLRLGNNDTN